MPILYWNPIAIHSFVEVILTLIITVFFGWRLAKSHLARASLSHHGIFFSIWLSLLVSALLSFLSHALPAEQAHWALAWVTPVASITISCFILFAFYFLEKPAANKHWAWLLIAMLIGITLFESYISISRWQLLREGIVEYRAHWTEIPIPYLFVLAQILLVVHVYQALAHQKSQSFNATIKSSLFAILIPSTPLNQQGKAARAFFYFTLLPILLGCILVAQMYGLLSWRSTEVVSTWVFLSTLSALTVVYLNYIPDRTSFRVKLVGAMLLALLMIVSGIAWLIGPVYSDAYLDQSAPKQQTALRFESSAAAYSVDNTTYQFDDALGKKLKNTDQSVALPFQFPFFNETYKKVYLNQSGMLGFNHSPRWQDVKHQYGPQPAVFISSTALDPEEGNQMSGVFVKAARHQVTITWHQLVAHQAPNQRYSLQLKLFDSGAIEMHFVELPKRPSYDYYQFTSAPVMTGIVSAYKNRFVQHVSFSDDLPITLSNGRGVIQNTRTAYLVYLNKIYEPVAYFILLAILLVVIIFPYFFRVNLDRPLDQLIKGVYGILQGNLNTRIKPFYRDEIGYLATSFNQMAKEQASLIQNLEDKVAERTAEASKLAAENARLEERNHLARELHDAVSQTLFSANLIADRIPNLNRENQTKSENALIELQQLNKSALQEMRYLILQLSPQKLLSNTFGQLLQSLANEVEQKFKTTVQLQIDSDVTLPEEVQVTFFRVAQEALTNACKYAKSEIISVYFDGIKDQALLTITDYGKGFNQKAVPPGHLGLQIMQERMQTINGNLEIQSQVDKGTSITAIWMLQNG